MAGGKRAILGGLRARRGRAGMRGEARCARRGGASRPKTRGPASVCSAALKPARGALGGSNRAKGNFQEQRHSPFVLRLRAAAGREEWPRVLGGDKNPQAAWAPSPSGEDSSTPLLAPSPPPATQKRSARDRLCPAFRLTHGEEGAGQRSSRSERAATGFADAGGHHPAGWGRIPGY